MRNEFTVEAVVEFEYAAEQEDELSFKVGDIITNVKTSEGGWWEGELRGKKGLFPENFVQMVRRREPASVEEKREAPQRKSVRELASRFKDNVPVGGPPKKKEKQKRCKALYDYKKENDDELELAVGDIVDFHKEVEDGWWEGSLNGKQGVFPSNFVEMLEETPSSDEGNTPAVEEKDKEKPAADTQGKDSDFHTIKGKKVVGVGLGNIFGGGPIKLRAVADSGKKEDTPKSAAQEVPEPAPEITVREKPNAVERAVVRFSYVAEQPDELSLTEGQIVRILEKQLEDDGWWKGEFNGKIGVFPDNFVELLSNEKTNKPQKPPPPAAATTKNALPKLPDRPPVSDVADEKIKTESQSPSFGKKPLVPPPTIKKPVNQKSTELKPEPSIPHQPVSSGKDKSAVRENHTENHNSQGTIQFDDIEPASQKLTHLTYGRAQGPKKRPPSSVMILNDGEKDDITEQIKNNHLPTPDKQQSRLPEKLDMEKSQSRLPDRPDTEKPHSRLPDRPDTEKPHSRLPDRPDTEKPHSRLPDRPDTEKPHSRLPDRTDTEKPHSRNPDRPDKPLPNLPPKDYRSPQPSQQTENASVTSHSATVTSLRDRDLHLNTPPPRPPEPTKAPPSSQSTFATSVQTNKLLEQLHQELADLKSNSVSKAAFLELRVQHEKLKVEFESLKKIHSGKIRDLANEVDDEKKLRLSTQVEVERIKKLLAETHV